MSKMLSWADFGAEVPHLAAFGRRRLERRIAYLATIRTDGSPRVHPVSPFISGGCLAIYMEPTSLKAADLRRDARYALHCAVEDNEGGEGELVQTLPEVLVRLVDSSHIEAKTVGRVVVSPHPSTRPWVRLNEVRKRDAKLDISL